MGREIFKLHFAVALAGTTGVFGKWISLDAVPLVWYRLLLSFAVCALYFICTRKSRNFSIRDFLKIGSVGAVLAIHWFLFYASIKLSNVSVGVICFSSTSFFTAILGPLLSHRKPSVKETLFGISALAGVAFIFSFDLEYRQGIVAGVLCAVGASLFNILNKRIGKNYSASTMLIGELAGGSLLASVVLPLYLFFFRIPSVPVPGFPDFAKLLVFAVLCTVWLQFLQIQSLQDFSPFAVSLAFSLEPLYSILYAAILFGEFREWSPALIAGFALIVIPIALQTREIARCGARNS